MRHVKWWEGWRAFRQDENGSSLLEFAASASAVLLFTLGIMEASRAMYIDHFVCNAARDAARYAMVRGSGWSGTSCSSYTSLDCVATAADVASFVQGSVPLGISASKLVVNTSWPGVSAAGSVCDTSSGANSRGCSVSVQVSYPFLFFLPLPDRSTFQLQSTAVTTISQ